MRTIAIAGLDFVIYDDQETKDAIFETIIKWMQDKKHTASTSGEGIMQDDNCTIDASVLISNIVDDHLKPTLEE